MSIFQSFSIYATILYTLECKFQVVLIIFIAYQLVREDSPSDFKYLVVCWSSNLDWFSGEDERVFCPIQTPKEVCARVNDSVRVVIRFQKIIVAPEWLELTEFQVESALERTLGRVTDSPDRGGFRSLFRQLANFAPALYKSLLRIDDGYTILVRSHLVDRSATAAVLEGRSGISERLIPSAEEAHRVERLLLHSPRASILVFISRCLGKSLLVRLREPVVSIRDSKVFEVVRTLLLLLALILLRIDFVRSVIQWIDGHGNTRLVRIDLFCSIRYGRRCESPYEITDEQRVENVGLHILLLRGDCQDAD